LLLNLLFLPACKYPQENVGKGRLNVTTGKHFSTINSGKAGRKRMELLKKELSSI
jgi:hypothetical protein